MKHLLTALCAALVIWGGVFISATNSWDEDVEADW